MRRDWEDAHKVTEELVEGPPSRRANATFTPCPVGNYLWCIGGEFFSEDGKAVSLYRKYIISVYLVRLKHFYNDVFRYNPEKVIIASKYTIATTAHVNRTSGENTSHIPAQALDPHMQ